MDLTCPSPAQSQSSNYQLLLIIVKLVTTPTHPVHSEVSFAESQELRRLLPRRALETIVTLVPTTKRILLVHEICTQ